MAKHTRTGSVRFLQQHVSVRFLQQHVSVTYRHGETNKDRLCSISTITCICYVPPQTLNCMNGSVAYPTKLTGYATRIRCTRQKNNSVCLKFVVNLYQYGFGRSFRWMKLRRPRSESVFVRFLFVCLFLSFFAKELWPCAGIWQDGLFVLRITTDSILIWEYFVPVIKLSIF